MNSEETKKINFIDVANNVNLPTVHVGDGSECKSILNSTQVRGHRFYLTPDKALTPAAINEKGLAPFYHFDLYSASSVRKIGLSLPFRHKHRIFFYIYVQHGSDFIVRTVYQSGSQVLFTLLPEYTPGLGLIGHYGKGYGEASIRLALPFQMAFAQILQDTSFVAFDSLKETAGAIAGPSRMRDKAKTSISNSYYHLVETQEVAQLKYRDFFSLGELDNINEVFNNGYFRQPDKVTIVRKGASIAEQKLCSFTLPSVVYTKTGLLDSSSDVTFDVFASDDESLLYYMARSEIMLGNGMPQCWPCHVEIIKNNPVTELGIRNRWFPVSAFIRPGLEYPSQAGSFANESIQRVVTFDFSEDTILDGGHYSLLKDENNTVMIVCNKTGKYTDITLNYQSRFPDVQRYLSQL